MGCHVGGLLAAAGADVTLLLRARTATEIRGHGLTLTGYDGMAQKVPAERLDLSDRPACLARADIILVTVKSADTAGIAALIADHARPGTHVISLQNGVGNAAILREALPSCDVRAGMVPFNVVPLGQGAYHRASSGTLVIETGPEELSRVLQVPYLPVSETREIEPLLWGKFLVNLTNALNALSGLPLATQLQDRGWRRLMADQWAEALTVLRANGIRPQSTTSVGVGLVPWILRLPNGVFRRVAAAMLTIDPQARTSMAHDLMTGRPTEIDALQGEVIRLGAACGIPTPINARVAEVMELAELAAEGLPHLPVRALRDAG